MIMKQLVVILLLLLGNSNFSLFGQKSEKITTDDDFRNHLYFSIDSLNQLELEQYLKIKSVKLIFNKQGQVREYYLSAGKEFIKIKKKNYRLILALLNQKNYSNYINILRSNHEWDKKNKYVVRMPFLSINNGKR